MLLTTVVRCMQVRLHQVGVRGASAAAESAAQGPCQNFPLQHDPGPLQVGFTTPVHSCHHLTTSAHIVPDLKTPEESLLSGHIISRKASCPGYPMPRQVHHGPGLILALHAACRYLGQINATDFFTRLLCGVAYTGIAPPSFYTAPNGSRPHFDGTPVDVVAGVIAGTVSHERSGLATYHVVNPHYSDGVSLDSIVSWLASAGIKARLFQISSPLETY